MNKDNYLDIIKAEGDYYEWYNDGLKCFVKRNDMLCLCGYVEIPSYYKIILPENDDLEHNYDVHGGVTYEQHDDNGNYVIGFDCCHGGDLYPYYYTDDNLSMFVRGIYRDKDYVISETNSLCSQIKNTYSDLVSVIRHEKLTDIL